MDWVNSLNKEVSFYLSKNSPSTEMWASTSYNATQTSWAVSSSMTRLSASSKSLLVIQARTRRFERRQWWNSGWTYQTSSLKMPWSEGRRSWEVVLEFLHWWNLLNPNSSELASRVTKLLTLRSRIGVWGSGVSRGEGRTRGGISRSRSGMSHRTALYHDKVWWKASLTQWVKATNLYLNRKVRYIR